MAPSATTTTTTEAVNNLAKDEANKLKLYPASGDYKELSPVAYSKEREESGAEAAKVRTPT